MTARSIRRAAERKAKKLARRDERNLVERPFQAAMTAFQPASDPTEHLCFESESTSPAPVSETRLAAKTGLTGRTMLLPSEDAERYELHVRDTFAEFQPVGSRETFLVQSLADTGWRMTRIPGLETTIFAYGRIQFADLFADHDAALRPGLIDMHTFLQYEKQLRNLQLQEGRLRRQFEKDLKELRTLQEARRDEACVAPKPEPQVLEQAIGFEFSTVSNHPEPAAALWNSITIDTEPEASATLNGFHAG